MYGYFSDHTYICIYTYSKQYMYYNYAFSPPPSHHPLCFHVSGKLEENGCKCPKIQLLAIYTQYNSTLIRYLPVKDTCVFTLLHKGASACTHISTLQRITGFLSTFLPCRFVYSMVSSIYVTYWPAL